LVQLYSRCSCFLPPQCLSQACILLSCLLPSGPLPSPRHFQVPTRLWPVRNSFSHILVLRPQLPSFPLLLSANRLKSPSQPRTTIPRTNPRPQLPRCLPAPAAETGQRKRRPVVPVFIARRPTSLATIVPAPSPLSCAVLTLFPARPCQRCVKRGIAANCTEGHRKKAKYLLDEEELGMSPPLLPRSLTLSRSRATTEKLKSRRGKSSVPETSSAEPSPVQLPAAAPAPPPPARKYHALSVFFVTYGKSTSATSI
jgi:hypothetical protein